MYFITHNSRMESLYHVSRESSQTCDRSLLRYDFKCVIPYKLIQDTCCMGGPFLLNLMFV